MTLPVLVIDCDFDWLIYGMLIANSYIYWWWWWGWWWWLKLYHQQPFLNFIFL